MTATGPVVSDGTARTCLVTGFPLDAARRVALELAGAGDRVLLLCRDKFARDAREIAAHVAEGGSGAIEVIEGDILAIDLGLDGAAVRRLCREVTEIHHLAAIHYLGVDLPRMRQLNVEGLREVLELALGFARLERICVWSTVFVSGNRTGVVLEHELMRGQRFRNAYEQTKAEAERLARRAMGRLPITVARVPIVVGDSRTGESARTEGVYAVAASIVHSSTAIALPVPGAHPLHVVPIDYAVRAAVALSRHPDARGGTFHLVDERPLTARAFFDAIADAAGRPRPIVTLHSRVGHALARLPTLSGEARHARSLLGWFEHDVRFDAARTRALLGPLRCPPAHAWVDAVVHWLRDRDERAAEGH